MGHTVPSEKNGKMMVNINIDVAQIKRLTPKFGEAGYAKFASRIPSFKGHMAGALLNEASKGEMARNHKVVGGRTRENFLKSERAGATTESSVYGALGEPSFDVETQAQDDTNLDCARYTCH